MFVYLKPGQKVISFPDPEGSFLLIDVPLLSIGTKALNIHRYLVGGKMITPTEKFYSETDQMLSCYLKYFLNYKTSS